MKVNVKFVTGGTTAIEVSESEKVADLKAKIHGQKGDAYAVELQKVIHSGKILADDVELGSLKLGEKEFVVCMASKPKAAPKPAPTEAPKPAETTATPAAQAAPATTIPATTAPVTSSAPATTATPAQPVEAFASVATGAQFESAINNLMEMGYPRDKVVRAMRAAFNNPDRAAEYLMTDSIPDVGLGGPASGGAAPSPASATSPSDAAQPAAAAGGQGQEFVNLFDLAQQQRQGNAPAASAGAGAGAGAAGALGAMMNNPQMGQLQQLLQTNPQMLQSVLQQIGATNPQLLQLLNQNPEALLQILGGLGGEGLDDEEGAEGEEGAAGGAQYLQVSPEESAAIDRLCALGFDRQQVIEAYFACDKNEELAANYLFDSMGDL